MYSGSSNLLSIHEAYGGCVTNHLDNAREIGCYSVDAQECIHYDRSEMKYYIQRDQRNLRLDLNTGCRDGVRPSHDKVKILNNLLRWIENSRFEPLHEHSIDFVCRRGVMKSLLNTPYCTEHWTICACRVGDVIYLNTVELEDRPEYGVPENQKNCRLWGFVFEQYMTADRPDGIPAMRPITHQMEKFYIVVKNRIGSYNLLMSSETDGMDPSSSRSDSGDPSCYVEMKTSKYVPNFLSNYVFQRYKSRDWWAQTVCSSTGKIICGLRDEGGIVRDIQIINPSGLTFLCQNLWSSTVCINFCYSFLDYLRKKLTVNDPRIVCKCEYTGGSTVSVSWEKNPTGPFNLIPDWYEREMRKY